MPRCGLKIPSEPMQFPNVIGHLILTVLKMGYKYWSRLNCRKEGQGAEFGFSQAKGGLIVCSGIWEAPATVLS